MFGDSCGHHRPMKLNYFGHRPSKSPCSHDSSLLFPDFPLESAIFRVLREYFGCHGKWPVMIAIFFFFFEENEIDFSFDDKREMLYNYRLMRFSRQMQVLRVLSNERIAVHFSRVTIYIVPEKWQRWKRRKGMRVIKNLGWQGDVRFRNVSWRKRVIKFLLSNGTDTEQEDPRVKKFFLFKI